MKVSENPEVLSLADFGVYCGIAVGVISVVIHLVASWRRDRREVRGEKRSREYHRLRMAELAAGKAATPAKDVAPPPVDRAP